MPLLKWKHTIFLKHKTQTPMSLIKENVFSFQIVIIYYSPLVQKIYF